jgi:hypothetical protein
MARPGFVDGPGSEALRAKSCSGKCDKCEFQSYVLVLGLIDPDALTEPRPMGRFTRRAQSIHSR